MFGPPPLYCTEDTEAYDQLYDRLRSAIAPNDVIEEIWVRDVADLTWDCLRLRRLKAKKMHLMSKWGLMATLERLRVTDESRRDLSYQWDTGGPSARHGICEFLRKSSVNPDNLEALDLSDGLDDLERMDRMIMRSEARRNVALREIDRHRDAVARRLREAVAEIEDAEFEDVSSADGEHQT